MRFALPLLGCAVLLAGITHFARRVHAQSDTRPRREHVESVAVPQVPLPTRVFPPGQLTTEATHGLTARKPDPSSTQSGSASANGLRRKLENQSSSSNDAGKPRLIRKKGPGQEPEVDYPSSTRH